MPHDVVRPGRHSRCSIDHFHGREKRGPDGRSATPLTTRATRYTPDPGECNGEGQAEPAELERDQGQGRIVMNVPYCMKGHTTV